MRKLLFAMAAVALLSTGITQAAAEETWKGTISDAMCGAKHSADKHGDAPGDHAACVKKCIAGGGEYVLVTDKGMHKIANQSFPALKEHAGHEVMLTGEMKDDRIVVSKIEMPKGDK